MFVAKNIAYEFRRIVDFENKRAFLIGTTVQVSNYNFTVLPLLFEVFDNTVRNGTVADLRNASGKIVQAHPRAKYCRFALCWSLLLKCDIHRGDTHNPFRIAFVIRHTVHGEESLRQRITLAAAYD